MKQGPGEFDPPGSLFAIWEWAECSLLDFLSDPDEDPRAVAGAVESNVGAALAVLHGIGIVHLDVAPNNILRVDGTWKLADLDSCVERGMPASRVPRVEFYVHPDRIDANPPPPARDEFDTYGLSRVLSRLRS
jgi:serine/threonine protein kinase